jgi:hypothetical protein
MVVVEVYLGLEGRGSIKLNHKIIGGHSGDTIIWHVHSVGNAAAVEIDFGTFNYFPSHGAMARPQPSLRVPLRGGYGRLVGTIPGLAGAPPSTEMHKYTIRSLDGHGGVIAERDPYVVPSEP